MKAFHCFLLFLTGSFFVLCSSSLQAEDWTTTDGVVYHHVVVVKVEPDAVTILHQDGGALVPLTKLSPDLQKRFDYDPDVAVAAAAVRALADAASAKALWAERLLAQKLQQAKLQDEDPSTTKVTADATASVITNSSDVSHHTRGELVDPSHRLMDDVDYTDHHSMGALFGHNPHLTDPDDTNHSGMADLFGSNPHLSNPPSDPTHHPMSELF